MKMLVHRVAIVTAPPYSYDLLKSHLRVDGSEEDELIDAMGRTAAADIEQFAQIALLSQTVRLTIFEPDRHGFGLSLPVGPVLEDAQIAVSVDGQAFTGFKLIAGLRPYIRWLAPWYDITADRLTVEYQAGFGDEASAIPADLALAVMDQAALLYDARSPGDGKTLPTSPHMARIGARYRGVAM